jgi:hypothetical protein
MEPPATPTPTEHDRGEPDGRLLSPEGLLVVAIVAACGLLAAHQGGVVAGLITAALVAEAVVALLRRR